MKYEDGLIDLQSKPVSMFMHFPDVVLQVIKEELHHVQFLLGPPASVDRNISTKSQTPTITVIT